LEYISTRGFGPVSFERTILDGLAPDGGLYVPTSYPKFPFDKMEELTYLSYEEVAEVVMSPFIGDSIPRETFRTMRMSLLLISLAMIHGSLSFTTDRPLRSKI
jgi:threonine synthase